MNNWKETTLDEAIELIGGGTPKTSIAEYWNGDIPWLSIADFNNNSRWVEKTDKTITKEGLKNSATRILDVGDIVISARGTVGEMAQLKKPMALNQSCYGIRAKNGNDQNFLYYLIKYNLNKIKKNVHGAVFDTITKNTFSEVGILLPSPREQKQIAAALSGFDDKIELLRRQNEVLEKIAQGIFKEWFVNFTIDGKELKLKNGVPEGWKIGKIDDLCERLNSGGTPSTKNADYYNGNINWFSTKELQDKFLFDSEKKITDDGLKNSSTKLFPAGSVLMAIYAAPTVGRLGILTKESTFNQAACGFVANKKVACGEFIYLFLFNSRDNFNNLSNGAAQQNLSVGLVRNHSVIIPQAETMNKFKKVIQPQFKKILNNSTQIQTLSRLRDILLPKLMSGGLNYDLND